MNIDYFAYDFLVLNLKIKEFSGKLTTLEFILNKFIIVNRRIWKFNTQI